MNLSTTAQEETPVENRYSIGSPDPERPMEYADTLAGARAVAIFWLPEPTMIMDDLELRTVYFDPMLPR